MRVRIEFQGIEESPWMNEYLEGRTEILAKYVPADTLVTFHFHQENFSCKADLEIQTPKHDYSFSAVGCGLYESFSHLLNKARSMLRNEHVKFLNKVHQSFIQL